MKKLVLKCIFVLVLFPGLVFGQTESVQKLGVFVVPSENTQQFLKADTGNYNSYTVFGENTVFLGKELFLDSLKKNQIEFEHFPLNDTEKVWLFASKDPDFRDLKTLGVRVVLKTHGFQVILADETTVMGLSDKLSEFAQIVPLPKNEVILTPLGLPKKSSNTDQTSLFLDGLDCEAFKADVLALADLKTRYTYSKGALLALDYCEKSFKDLGFTTSRLPFSGMSQKRENLMAVQPGTATENPYEVLIVGHLDSTSNQASTIAPGADDNGSGAAGVIALARLFKDLKPAATIKYLLFLGEEQGMVGSKAYVAGLSTEELKKIRVVINMDMIGFDVEAPVSTLIETYSFNKPMAEKMAELAEKYTELATQISYHAWGSDHIPFLKKNIPTVLTIESEFDNNPTYHKTNDLPEFINWDLGKGILRLNAVATIFYAEIPLPETDGK